MTRAGFGSAIHRFDSVSREVARGMTDVGVGSGVLFGETQTWNASKPKSVLSCEMTRRVFISLGKQEAPTSRRRDRMLRRAIIARRRPRLLDLSMPSRTASWPRRTIAGLSPRTEREYHQNCSRACFAGDHRRGMLLLPNVKDEPRRHLARRVQESIQDSAFSIL